MQYLRDAFANAKLSGWEVATFVVYFILILTIGWHFYRKTRTVEQYLLGGRALGRWVTAISAQASDMSGWLLMGLPGAVYLSGLCEAWIAVGLFVGTALNWYFVAPRLRAYTERTDSITLPHYFEERFGDPTGLLRILSALIMLVFFTIYAAAQMSASGKLFEVMFNLDYYVAMPLAAVIIIAYTLLGGYLAVCWTDLVQGLLMVTAILVVPVVAWIHMGGPGPLAAIVEKQPHFWQWFATSDKVGLGAAVLTAISAAAWGLGYFGQPHILARFMSSKSIGELAPARRIALVWVILSLGFAVIVGLLGRGMIPGLDTPAEAEKVFIYMVRGLFPAFLSGFLLAAILAAAMSTIDSQLLVSSSVLTEDLCRKAFRRTLTETQRMWMGRAGVALISLVALALAWDKDSSVFGLVKYSWSGFGAAFGPLVLVSLYSRRVYWPFALAGMVAGTVTMVVWERLGYGAVMYEIVPGFAVNLLILLVGRYIVPERREAIRDSFDHHADSVRAAFQKKDAPTPDAP